MTEKGIDMKLFRKIGCIIAAIGVTVGLTGCSGTSLPGNISEQLTFQDGDLIAEISIENYGTMKAKLFPDIAPNGVKNFTELAKQGYYDGLKIHRVAADMCIQGGSLNGDGTGGTAVINKDGEDFDIEISENARNFYGALGYANTNGKNNTQFYIVNCKKQKDITTYDSSAIKALAEECTSKAAELPENDTDRDVLTAQATYYTNLADLTGKASEGVINRYKTTGGYPAWDGGYTVFGQVYEGLDVLDKISAAEVTVSASGELSKPVEDIVISSIKIIEYVTPEPAPEESTSSK